MIQRCIKAYVTVNSKWQMDKYPQEKDKYQSYVNVFNFSRQSDLDESFDETREKLHNKGHHIDQKMVVTQ